LISPALAFRGVIMDLHLVGKTALVTGASMGIGRAIAKGLAGEGIQVAAVARRTHLLDELASEIERGQRPRPLLITQDIMAADAARRLRDAALLGLGHVDILVNCAEGRCRSMRQRSGGKKRSRSTSPGYARLHMLCFRK
jgi:NAD(P)-dependent dehydrogenase (short-subunit alcohol dehydrogenase family)